MQTAGQEIAFTVYARDRYGNAVSSDTSSGFTARLRTPRGDYVQGIMDQSSSTASEYQYIYVATESGVYEWIPYYGLL